MAEPDDDLSLRSTGTLTLWLTCLIVGAVGLVYPHGPPPARLSILHTQATTPDRSVEVMTMRSQPAEQQAAPPAEPLPAPPPPEPVANAVPPLPQIAVAPLPSPFAIPRKVQTSVAPATRPSAAAQPTQVSAAKATPTRSQPMPSAPKTDGHAAVQQLVYGQGEGRQPPPDYPRESQLGQQQGTVVVQFAVNSAGNVIRAEVKTRCPWPLLNQAAVRAVQETWRFVPGEPRTFEVAIRFQLQRNSM